MGILKADWPCAQGKEIDSAYFEDLRKMLWGFNKFGCGITGDVRMKDWEGNWNYPLWNPNTTYHANKSDPEKTIHFRTVIYYDKDLKEYLPYRNTLRIYPHQAPPSENRNWRRIPRKDVYCDYFPNKDIWHVEWSSWGAEYGYSTGVIYWMAYLDFPMYLGKYHVLLAAIPKTEWETEQHYHYGNIVKTTSKRKAIRQWCKVPHFSTNQTAAEKWDGDKAYPENALAEYNDKLYAALRDIGAGEAAPTRNIKWIGAGHHTDASLWNYTAREYYDYWQPPAGEIYGKSQEDLLVLSTFYLSGIIGPIYPHSRGGGDVMFYRPYYVTNGRAAESGSHTADRKASGHYQSYVDNFLSRFGSHFSEKNPRFNKDGTPDQQMVWKTCDDPIWKCNQNGFEFCLDKIGRYDWYLDIYHPPQTTAPSPVPPILATWRRMWKYSYSIPDAVCFTAKNPDTGELETLPLIWPQEKGSPPYQQYCYQAIDADPTYDYNFWRKSSNVYRAYQIAVGRLTDEDIKLVKGRHYHRIYADLKDYQLNHQLVQDMYDALMMYKYLNVTSGYAGESRQVGGGTAKSFKEVRSQIRISMANNTWDPEPLPAYIGGYAVAWSDPNIWDSWRGQGSRTVPTFVVIAGSKDILDKWAEQNPALVVLVTYYGYDFGYEPDADEKNITPGCDPPQPSEISTITYNRFSLQMGASNLICNNSQERRTEFLVFPESERMSDTQINFTATPSISDIMAGFNSPEGQPRKPLSGCPIEQPALFWWVSHSARLFIENWDTSAAVKISPVQPLGCTPLED